MDHASEKTPNFSNTIAMLKRIELLTLPEIRVLIFFSSVKNFPFPSLSYFLSGWVIEFREPSLSSPPLCPPPVLNDLLCCFTP